MSHLPQQYAYYPPQPGGHYPAPEPAGTQLADLGRLLSVVWRRKFRIGLCTLLGIGLALAYLKVAPRVYRSSAEVLVVPRKPYNLSGDLSRYAYLLDDLAMHDAMIKSPHFAIQAIERGNLRGLTSLQGVPDVSVAVAENLSVQRMTAESRNSPNSVINISYRSGDPDDCLKVLSAVTDEYRQFIQVKGQGDEALAHVSDKAEEVWGQLQAKQAALATLRAGAPSAYDSASSGALQQGRVAEIERRRAELMMRRVETERQLNSLRNAIRKGISSDEVASLDLGSTSQATRSESMHKHLLPLLLEEQSLLDKFGAGHPDVIAVRQRISTARDFIAASEEQGRQALATLGKEGQQSPTEFAQAQARMLEQQLAQVSDSERALNELYSRERSTLTSVTEFEAKVATAQADIERSRLLYDDLTNRVRETSLSRDMLGYDTTVIAPPMRGEKVAPSVRLVLPVGAFLGMQLGLALALLAESSDRRFRSPQDIRGRLGVRVIGHIPLHAPASRELRNKARLGEAYDPVLCTYYRPNSPEAEAYRGLRSALLFNQQGESAKLIQITSPSVGDGKSTVAANLAVALANSGKNVLLLDANLREPSLHHMFCLRSEDGLARLVEGGVELDDAIFPTSVKGLSVLPAGALPPHAQDLISASEFQNLLQLLREKYDVVLLDTPAILSATDALVVAKLVDGVVLTIRVTKEDRAHATQATELLMSLGANVLGVVVNARDGGRNYANSTKDTFLLEAPLAEMIHA